MIQLQKGAHCVYQLEYHLVWCPHWREACLTEKIGTTVYREILSACRNNQMIVQQLNVQSDHVHLCVVIPPSLCVSDAIGLIKSKSSWALGSNRFGKRSWSRGYFASSVGIDDETVKKYISTQGRRETMYSNS